MEVLDAIWIGNFGYNTLGIIKARDKITFDINFYIGIGQGINEQQDIHNIMAAGTKYTKEQFQDFFRKFLEFGE